METDLLFIVTYPCPGCQVELEDRSSGSPTWLRCPRCGRPSVPPDHQRWERPKAQFDPRSVGLMSAGSTAIPPLDRTMSPLPMAAGPTTSNLRLYLGIGFFASLFCFIFAMLDSNAVIAGITGIASFVCLLLLVGPAGRPPSA